MSDNKEDIMSKKEENIYKRKDNRWKAQYVKPYYSNGKIRCGYCYGKTYNNEEKEKWLQAVSYQNTEKKKHNNRPFSAYIDEWLMVSKINIKESTYAKYQSVINKYIRPCFGTAKLCNITSYAVAEFSDNLINQKLLSLKTVKDILILLKSILRYTAKQSDDLPEIDIIYPKIAREEVRTLTVSEQNKFTQYLMQNTDRYKFGILFALMTGIRIGELCALKVHNISFAEKTLTVNATMQRIQLQDSESLQNPKVIITVPKSNYSARVIPLNEYLLALCQKFLSHNPQAYFLTGSETKFTEPRTLQYKFKKYCKDCQLDNVHFHTLRHTFATRCVEAGFEIKSLSEILGHSTPKITLERYVHSSLELKRINMNKLNTVFF